MKNGKNEKKGFLGRGAMISNLLPHPVTIFIILSVIFSKMGVAVEIEVINKSIKQIELRTLNVKNFASFEVLGIVLLFITLFFYFFNEICLFLKFLKRSMQKIKEKEISLYIAFLKLNFSFAGNSGYFLISGIIYKKFKKNTKRGLLRWSPLLSKIRATFCFTFFILVKLYDKVIKKVKNAKNLMNFLFKSLDGFEDFIVLCLFSSVFISWFSYTQLGIIIAARNGSSLLNIDLTYLPLVIAFMLFYSFANLFIGSMTSKYILFVPIFLLILYKIGISPELTQFAYRIGTSSIDIIFSFMSYFALVLMCYNEYNRKFGMRDFLSYIIHSIIIFISSLIILGIWLIKKLSIGLGTVNFL
ncbi:MAG: AbgT family transporter [Fusobacterium sp.]|uniref:AbgT family transporter n=1 Tax=Fusobacterium sp. TaxID=68766 RepID=UPI0026DD08A3|nr:AbgT family transporter [Fusobacterium sp.]MDO4690073.1 AbgT family transporter [Fusobacterium sp.]